MSGRAFSAAFAIRSGIGRAAGAWAIVAGIWLMTLVVSLPSSISVSERIAEYLGKSLEATVLVERADNDWLSEFASQSSGAAATLGSSVIGFAAVADSLETVLDGTCSRR